MAKGNRGGKGRQGGGGGLNPGDILETELISWSGDRTSVENDFFKTAESLHEKYGDDAVPQDFFVSAKLAPKAASTIAYYDGSNVGLNKAFANAEKLNSAYDQCVAQGFHPSRGDKSAGEAVAAHELGHRLTDAVGAKMGVTDIDYAATRIVNEARKPAGFRGVVQMARSISGYASTTNAEAIAEAVSDVYCNGSKAKKASKAIVNVIDSYLLGSK